MDNLTEIKKAAYRITERLNLPKNIDQREFHGVAVKGYLKARKDYRKSFKCKFSTYAYNKIYNAIKDELRHWNWFKRNKAEVQNLNGFLVPFLDLRKSVQPTQFRKATAREEVARFLAKLDNRSKAIVKMKDLEGYTVKDIAKKLNLTDRRVRQLHSKIIKGG